MSRYSRLNGVTLSSLLVLFLSLLLHTTSGARILITTPQHGSHVLDKLTIGETLVARGHDVYIAMSSRYPKMSDVSKTGVKLITFHVPPDVLIPDTKEFDQRVTDGALRGETLTVFCQWLSGLINRDCAYMMDDKIFLEKVKKLNFDLVITEPFLVCPCYLILPAHLNIPFVSLGLQYLPMEIRQPSLPSIFSISAPYSIESIRKLSLWDRLVNCFWYTLQHQSDFFLPGRRNITLIKNYAPQYSSWGEIIRKAELYLAHADHYLGSHVPAFPNFISVGGLTAVPAAPLPADLEKIMQDSGEHGVIMVSFGATAYYLPDYVIEIFLDAFSKVNQTVLARLREPKGAKVPPNVKLLKWLPQADIIGHPKTKLFITHCGNNGQYEALYNAVPMVGFPIFAEQHENSVRAEEKGISIGMNIRDFTADELVRNIHKVIYTDFYRNKIKEMSERWRDEKFGPRERAAFWIEHVIKYGGRHLRSPAMELSVYEFLMLDVILVVIAIFIIIAGCLIYVAKIVFRKLFATNSTLNVYKIKTT